MKLCCFAYFLLAILAASVSWGRKCLFIVLLVVLIIQLGAQCDLVFEM